MSHTHIFKASDIKDYEVCEDCGTYHSTAQVDPKIIYEEQEYWSYDNKRSKIEEQVLNHLCTDDCGISKVDRVLQFVPKGESVLEIACAPGALLKKLLDYGYTDVWGIEPSDRYITFICNQAPTAKILHGYFPNVTSDFSDNTFDCIVALDIFEHVEDYEAFLLEVKRLLKDGATAIIMSPIILDDGDGLYRNRDFAHPDEHCWIHSQNFLEPYLKEIFSEVKFANWIVGHTLIVVKK